MEPGNCGGLIHRHLRIVVPTQQRRQSQYPPSHQTNLHVTLADDELSVLQQWVDEDAHYPTP